MTLARLLIAVLAWLHAEGTTRDPWTAWTIVHAAVITAPAYDLHPAELLAVAGVESRWSLAPCTTPARACGVYQQIPQYSGMWHDDCWDGARLICRQPGATPYAPGELGGDVYLQTRVAARHLAHLRARYGATAAAAYNRGPRRRGDAIGARYTTRVERAIRRLR